MNLDVGKFIKVTSTKQRMTVVDKVIIGGGVVGCALALKFSKGLNGGSVVLVERNKISVKGGYYE